jgi:hypothetical protein
MEYTLTLPIRQPKYVRTFSSTDIDQYIGKLGEYQESAGAEMQAILRELQSGDYHVLILWLWPVQAI